MTHIPADIASPIDLRCPEHASAWAREAMERRPERTQFFAAIAEHLAAAGARRVLELGSGPGFLASHLVAALPNVELTLLDFSSAMHELARARLGAEAVDVRFVTRSFREPGWTEGLSAFDAVVTLQAVHELRHKRHAVALHRAVRETLRDGGAYLVCDHFAGEGGMENAELFMSVDEQQGALRAAGFAEVERVLQLGTLALQRARR